jgi:uncharacterized membrane protein YhiD involved in acid resistance
VGLASGVGLYVLAAAGTLLIGVALWTIEGFEPEVSKRFGLTVGVKGVTGLRPRIEEVLRRFHAEYELRASSADEVSYAVIAPEALRIDKVSRAITDLANPDEVSVEWDRKSPKKEP